MYVCIHTMASGPYKLHKRTVQFASKVSAVHWHTLLVNVLDDVLREDGSGIRWMVAKSM